MVLQLNGGEPAFQIRQTARPIEFEAALRGAPGFCRSRLRQELDECLHLLLRQDGQSFIFGDQCVSAHNRSCYPQPAGVAIRHLDSSSGWAHSRVVGRDAFHRIFMAWNWLGTRCNALVSSYKSLNSSSFWTCPSPISCSQTLGSVTSNSARGICSNILTLTICRISFRLFCTPSRFFAMATIR